MYKCLHEDNAAQAPEYPRNFPDVPQIVNAQFLIHFTHRCSKLLQGRFPFGFAQKLQRLYPQRKGHLWSRSMDFVLHNALGSATVFPKPTSKFRICVLKHRRSSYISAVPRQNDATINLCVVGDSPIAVSDSQFPASDPFTRDSLVNGSDSGNWESDTAIGESPTTQRLIGCSTRYSYS